MGHPLYSIVFSFFLAATSFAGPTVYYAVSEGEDYGKITWHTTDLARFEKDPPENVFDSYIISPNEDGTLSAIRDYFTPSGDWSAHLIYCYGKNGRLRAMEIDFKTFNGISDSGESDGPTRCVRTFKLSPEGKWAQTSVRITDLKTGKNVSRKFWEPKIEHWMTLESLPVKLEKTPSEPQK